MNFSPTLLRILCKRIALLIVLALGAQTSYAQILAWEFNSALGNEGTIAATTLAANLNASVVSRGAGVNPSALNNSFSSTDYTNAGTPAQAITNNDYLQFTIGAQTGFTVSLSTLDVNFRRSSSGPNSFQWQYSLNGFSTAGVAIGGAISFTNTTTNGVAQTQLNLSSIPALQGVAAGTTITFRLFGSGATATTGTFAWGRLAGNDLAIGGTVQAQSTNTTVQYVGSTGSVSEGVGTTPVQVSISNPSPTVATSVTVNLQSGPSARINGFTSQVLNFPANSGATQSVTITVTDNGVVDGNAVLVFNLTSLSGGQGTVAVGTPATFTLTIADNDLPTASFSANTSNVTEAGVATIGVTMTQAPTSDAVVQVSPFGGTATNGTDYSTFSNTNLTFLAAASYPNTQTFNITTTSDLLVEGTETALFQLSYVSGPITIGVGGAQHTLSILDDDLPTLLINEVDYDMPGTNDSLEFVELKNTGLNTISLSGFNVQLVNGSGGGAVVYTTVPLPNVTLAAGAYFVLGNDASIPNINLVTGANFNFIQNGSPDAIGLRDPSNNLIDAVSYEGNTGAPYTEGTGISVPNSDDATVGIGISRFPDGSDSNDNSADWGRHCLSPGATNNASSTNCICTPPAATATTQCIDQLTWQITVNVTSTGSGSVVNITNNQTGSSALNAGVGDHILGPFNNNVTVNVTVAHQTFTLCNLSLNGLSNNCVIDCNNVQGGPDVPGAPCDDMDAGTENDVWSAGCICAGTPIVPAVGFSLPSSTSTEPIGIATIGVEMNIAPTGPVVVDITDALTGTATSGTDYTAIGTQQLTFLPTDTYPYTQSINVLITDDPDYEPTETVHLALAVSSGTANTTTNTHSLSILSDDLAPLRINEVDYDMVGTDNAEWIELKNTGATVINILGFKVQLVNGGGGGAVVYTTYTLPSFNLAAGAYYVLGNNATIPNLNQLITPATDAIQNGAPDAIGLRDPTNTLLDAISYEGNSGAPYTEGTGLVAGDDNTTASKVIARVPDGADSDINNTDWKVWCASPGASNNTVDADGDGIPNCLDNCPNLAGVQGGACDDLNACTINDVISALCVCAGTFQDTDGDGICNANDPCPFLANLSNGQACDDGNVCTINDVVTACVCAGTFQDTDGDGICDANDPCPFLANLSNGQACDDGNVCTIGDVVTACVCAGTFQDTDGDGICDANDPCPFLANLRNGHACDDGNVCTINDVVTACVCAGTFQDTDGDGICDANDNCPNNFGVVGSACNDGNPFTAGDVLQNDCSCTGIPVPCDNWTLTFKQGTQALNDTWQIVDATSPFVLANGGPYALNSTNVATFCVPQGACFNLIVTDLGNNGMPGGGWVLRSNTGARVIDNEGNGAFFTSTAEVSTRSPQVAVPFCSPLSSNGLIQTVGITSTCDKENYTMDQTFIASPSPAVVAPGDGYQFWIFNPDGKYSRRVFQSGATYNGHSDLDPNDACYLRFGWLVTDPVPKDTLLNVRVRTKVGGIYGAFGPVCRAKILTTQPSCLTTKLVDNPLNPNYSCGVTKVAGGSDKLTAWSISPTPCANKKYQFEIRLDGEGYLRYVYPAATPVGNSTIILGKWVTNPLLCGTYTYEVRVHVSCDGGLNYCPFGDMCLVTITNNQTGIYCTPPGIGIVQNGNERATEVDDSGVLNMWPNPNNGDELFLTMNGFDTQVTTVTVDIYDLFGQRVMNRRIAVEDGTLNTVLALNKEMASGLYFVNITAGSEVRTERLVIQ